MNASPYAAIWESNLEVDRLRAEIIRLTAEVERLRAIASRPVSWASPAGPCSVSVIGRFAAPGGAGGGEPEEIEV